MVGITGTLKKFQPKPRRRFNIAFGVPRTIKPSFKQSGKIPNIKRDKARRALAPGKRVSRTGKIYFETRRNRSDLSGGI